MDKSLSHFELSESAIKTGSDSEQGSQGSDKSEPIELLGYGDTDQSSSNGSKSDEDFDNNLPETVTLLKHEQTGAKVYLIGTVHFDKGSQEDVKKVIENVLPNVVVLELCESRRHILSLDEQTILEEAKNLNFNKIMSTIKSNGVYNGIMYLLLLNVSARLTKQLGMAPGGEFRVAYQEGKKVPNCEVYLGDRPIGITVQRGLAGLSWFKTIKLAWHLITSQDTVSPEEIEKFKKRDVVEQILANLAGEYPEFRKVFLDERDIYLTCSLQTAAKQQVKKQVQSATIVGVVGIGHVPGITKLFQIDQLGSVGSVMLIPPPSLSSRIIRTTYKISLLTLGGYIIYRYVPVPKVLREQVHVIFHKVLTSAKTKGDLKYTFY